MKKKTILHIITGLGDGGAEGVLSRLCLNSANFKHEVISLTDEGKYGPTLRSAGINVRCLHLSYSFKFFIDFIKMIYWIRQTSPDVVQTWMYHADFVGGLAARIAGIKSILWNVRMTSFLPIHGKARTKVLIKICAISSRFIPKKIIYCANSALKYHLENGYCDKKSLVIYNGFDLNLFKYTKKDKISIINGIHIKSKYFLLGMVARFDVLKDHNNLFHALSMTRSQGIQFKCLLVGNNMDYNNDKIVQLIKQYNLEDCIILIGPYSNIAKIMNCIDLHILSSSSEGFPNVIAESMACGTPCISTDVGDAKIIINDEAMCCSANDPESLSSLIIDCYYEWKNSPKNWEKRKLNCAKRIKKNFSLRRMIKNYSNIWIKISTAGEL